MFRTALIYSQLISLIFTLTLCLMNYLPEICKFSYSYKDLLLMKCSISATLKENELMKEKPFSLSYSTITTTTTTTPVSDNLTCVVVATGMTISRAMTVKTQVLPVPLLACTTRSTPILPVGIACPQMHTQIIGTTTFSS